MARRRAKAKRPSQRKSAFNLVNAAQTYINTGIITQAAFRVNPIQFFTGQQTLTSTKQMTVGNTGYSYGQTTSTTGYQPLANGSMMTLPELLGFDTSSGDSVPFGGPSLMGVSPMDQIRSNIAMNGGLARVATQTVLVNVGFAVGKKLLSRQRRGINKVLKMGGLRKDVMV